MTASRLHLTPLDLDGAALGILPSADGDRITQHLQSCADCSSMVRSREEAGIHFDRVVLPRGLSRLQNKVVQRRWRRMAAMFTVLLPVAATGFFLLVRGSAPPVDSDVRVKGAATVRAYAKRGDRVLVVQDGEALLPGDAVRFALDPSGLNHLIIASVDGRGKANIYFPYGGTASGRIDPTSRFELPGSLVLDASPGPERFFAFFSPTPLDATPVKKALETLGSKGVAAIRAAHALPLPDTLQASFLLEKRVTPP